MRDVIGMTMVNTAHWKKQNWRVIQMKIAGEFTTNLAIMKTFLYVPWGLMCILRLNPAPTFNPVIIFFLKSMYLCLQFPEKAILALLI